MTDLVPFFYAVSLLIVGLTAIVHIFFAIAVYADVTKMVNDEKLEPVFVPGIIWAVATLVGGVLAAAVYWLLNRSPLAEKKRSTSDFDIRDFLS